MERLKIRRFGFFLCFSAGTITGILAGLAIITAIVSYRLDDYYRMNAYLQSMLEEKNTRLEQLEKSINKGNYILKEIQVTLNMDDDVEADTLAIEKEVKKKFNSLLGREIKTLDAEMIADVIDKRIFRLDDKEYQLNITKIILAECLRLWIKVDLVD